MSTIPTDAQRPKHDPDQLRIPGMYGFEHFPAEMEGAIQALSIITGNDLELEADLAKLQVDNSKFKPTKNESTNYEMGENKVCVSAEMYTLLLIMKGKKVRFNGYDYLMINGDRFPIILREKAI